MTVPYARNGLVVPFTSSRLVAQTDQTPRQPCVIAALTCINTSGRSTDQTPTNGSRRAGWSVGVSGGHHRPDRPATNRRTKP
jgi:hypothetical protein